MPRPRPSPWRPSADSPPPIRPAPPSPANPNRPLAPSLPRRPLSRPEPPRTRSLPSSPRNHGRRGRRPPLAASLCREAPAASPSLSFAAERSREAPPMTPALKAHHPHLLLPSAAATLSSIRSPPVLSDYNEHAKHPAVRPSPDFPRFHFNPFICGRPRARSWLPWPEPVLPCRLPWPFPLHPAPSWPRLGCAHPCACLRLAAATLVAHTPVAARYRGPLLLLKLHRPARAPRCCATAAAASAY